MLLALVSRPVAIDFDDLSLGETGNQWQDEPGKTNPGQAGKIIKSEKSEKALSPDDLVIQIQLPDGKSRFSHSQNNAMFLPGRTNSSSVLQREPVFQSGDEVEIKLQIKSLELSEDQKPAKAIIEFDGKEVKKTINGTRLKFSADEIIEPQPTTSNQSYLVFKTTSSRDTEYFLKALDRAKSEFLPSDKIAYYDDFSATQEQSKNEILSTDLYRFDPKEIFDAGGLKIGKVKIFDRQERLINEKPLAVQNPVDWIYYSGHYTWNDGGALGGGGVDPWTIKAKNWKNHLEVLIMASCYAMDVNDPNGVMEEKTMGIRVGVNGSEWWRKFQGTALGYGGVAPSGGVDAAVAANLVREMAKSGVSREDEKAYSKKLAETWMRVNNTKFKATAAAAMDSDGNYYFVPSRGAKIGGLSIRPSIMNWTSVKRNQWEPENEELLKRSKFNEHISMFITEQTWNNRGGKPYNLQEALNLSGLKEQAEKAQIDPESEEFRNMLTKLVEYQAHVFYDLPSVYTYFDAAFFLGGNLTEDRPVTMDELRSHFTHPTQPMRSEFLPDRSMRKIIIREYVQRVASFHFGEKEKPPTLEFILSKFEGHLKLKGMDKQLIKESLDKIVKERMEPIIDDEQGRIELIIDDGQRLNESQQ